MMSKQTNLDLTKVKYFFNFQCLASKSLLILILFITAAATHSGFYNKWKLRDGNERFGVEKVINGTAYKPFVYRQLAPETARYIEFVTPQSIINLFQRDHEKIEKKMGTTNVTYKYLIIYLMNFFFTLMALVLLRKLILQLGLSDDIATLSSCVFILMTPYLQTIGGFYYDSIELFALILAVLLANNNRLWPLISLTIFATFNKESFLFFIPTLYPLLRRKNSTKKTTCYIFVMIAISGLINYYIKSLYVNNLGATAEIHLVENIVNYLNLKTYFNVEITYGLLAPSGFNLLTLTLVSFIVLMGWKKLNKEFRQHCLIAAAISLPLFLTFAATGELRNLSFLYVVFACMFAHALNARTRSIVS